MKYMCICGKDDSEGGTIACDGSFICKSCLDKIKREGMLNDNSK